MLAWLMQILGGVVAWAIDWWVMKANNMNLAVETNFTSYLGFQSRCFGCPDDIHWFIPTDDGLVPPRWRMGNGYLRWMLMSGGIDVVSAGGVGGMIVVTFHMARMLSSRCSA